MRRATVCRREASRKGGYRHGHSCVRPGVPPSWYFNNELSPGLAAKEIAYAGADLASNHVRDGRELVSTNRSAYLTYDAVHCDIVRISPLGWDYGRRASGRVHAPRRKRAALRRLLDIARISGEAVTPITDARLVELY